VKQGEIGVPYSNYSHSAWPNRELKQSDSALFKWFNKRGNRLNGDHVPVTRSFDLHARMDPFAQGGLDGDWLARNPLWSPWRQNLNRVPYVPGSATYAGSSAALNNFRGEDCECN